MGSFRVSASAAAAALIGAGIACGAATVGGAAAPPSPVLKATVPALVPAMGPVFPSASPPVPTVAQTVDVPISTAGGIRISIQGSNFIGVTAIDFGSTPGTGIDCTSTVTCQVEVPAAQTAGTVFVTVKAAGGTSPTYSGAGDELTYAYPTIMTLTPAIVSVNPLGLHVFTLSATLTGDGRPVPGVSVFFYGLPSANGFGNQGFCSAISNAKGVASCSALPSALSIIVNNGYTASAQGTATQLPALGSAPHASL
jgi:hypothetical protein